MWFFLQETQSNEILITAKKPLNKLKLRHSNKILTTATKHLTKKIKARLATLYRSAIQQVKKCKKHLKDCSH
jgi:hypothetical protein